MDKGDYQGPHRVNLGFKMASNDKSDGLMCLNSKTYETFVLFCDVKIDIEIAMSFRPLLNNYLVHKYGVIK